MIKTRMFKQMLIVLLAPGLFLALVLGYVRAMSGVYMVSDINPTGDSLPFNFTNANGMLFFIADDGTHGFELWKSDGTITGTVMISDINPGVDGSTPHQLTNMNGMLYFAATDDTYGREVWKSDGTMTGTTIVSDIYSGLGDGFAWETQLVRVGDTLYFGGDNDGTGGGLWKSDGTAAGTMLVKDIGAGGFTDVNGTLFFSGYTVTYGSELWKSDGTFTGTVMGKDINPGTDSSNLSGLTNVNGTLFFNATNGSDGYELWESDGTFTGTVMITDINPGAGDAVFWRSINPYTPVNNTIYFLADDGISGIELWKSDGTMTGTMIISDINPGAGNVIPSEITSEVRPINMNDTILFAADDGNHGIELWKSEGTMTGTTMISDINPGSEDALPADIFLGLYLQIIGANDTVFFAADDGSNGIELWKSDGTVAGTMIISDINPGSGDAFPNLFSNPFIKVNDLLFFRANDGNNGTELWALPLEAGPPPPSQNTTYLPLILK